LEDFRAKALVHAHPRIEEQAVGPPPLGVPLDLDERVALLPARANGRDERLEPVVTRDRGHPFDRRPAQTAALEIARDHDHERAEDIRTALVEAARDGPVDARGQVCYRAVPVNRNGTAA